MALARPTDRHAGFSEAEVDAMSVHVVAALLGVGENDVTSQAMGLARARHEAAASGRSLSWDDINAAGGAM